MAIEDTMLPKRAEILFIIRDHKMVTLDFLHRRFLNVSKRTIRYDLMQLVKLGLIKKRGVTRGVVYEAVDGNS